VRRVLFTVAATVLMAGAVPASALAHHHHHKHHARAHHRIRFERFGDTSAPMSMSSSDNAGKVQTFQNGVLTIVLNDGSTVSGRVTSDTELECMAPEESSTTHEDGDRSGDDNGSGDDQGQDQGDNDQGEDQSDNDQNENEANNCSTSNLTGGTVVHEASLRIGSAGAVWQKVELVS